MMEGRLKWLMKEHVDKINDEVDCVSSVMDSIKNNTKVKSSFLRIRRPIFILVAILILSTVAYATSDKFIELRNKDNQVVGTVEIMDDGTNHLESLQDSMDLFAHEVDESKYEEAVLVIDTERVYPYNIEIRLESDMYDAYDILKESNIEILLPERIGDFVFENANKTYETITPSEEEVNKYIEENTVQERFITIPIPSDNAKIIGYTYKVEGSETFYELNIRLIDDNSYVMCNPIDEYEIISLNDTDAFLYKSKYGGIRYDDVNGETGIITSENFYKILWYNTDLSIELSCRLGTSISFDGPLESEEDGSNVYLEVYPENTKEMITLFASQIASYLDSIAK